jgi:hypothetical protein
MYGFKLTQYLFHIHVAGQKPIVTKVVGNGNMHMSTKNESKI